ncbi:IclR family transcriptional regulator [Sinomonas gamaensis]|uniref:IclR family transcriptional regulator n=1 Tax=Sinomonas gamaensis TaxID=2565624 RepID=UPI001107AF91|nr:helix-turn-helix domain-containing protein [Sinomonas gamaensis]
MTSIPKGEPGPAPAVSRAIELLGLMARHPSVPMTVTELAREIGAARSSTRNICTALEAGGLVQHCDGGYRLGQRLVEFGGAYLYSFEQVKAFHEACAESALLARELVQAAILDGTEVLYVARHEGRAPLSLSAHVGDRLPAARTAVGIALLANLPDDALRRMFASGQSGPEGLLSKIRPARDRGFAIEAGSIHPAVVGVAAAVPSHASSPGFAVGVSLVGVRPTPEDLARYGRAVQSIAAQMARPARRA